MSTVGHYFLRLGSSCALSALVSLSLSLPHSPFPPVMDFVCHERFGKFILVLPYFYVFGGGMMTTKGTRPCMGPSAVYTSSSSGQLINTVARRLSFLRRSGMKAPASFNFETDAANEVMRSDALRYDGTCTYMYGRTLRQYIETGQLPKVTCTRYVCAHDILIYMLCVHNIVLRY